MRGRGIWIAISTVVILTASGCNCAYRKADLPENYHLGSPVHGLGTLQSIVAAARRDPRLRAQTFPARTRRPGAWTQPTDDFTGINSWVEYHDGGAIIRLASNEDYGVVFRMHGRSMYVNFHAPLFGCVTPANLGPLHDIVAALPLPKPQRDAIKRLIRARTVEKEPFSLVY